MERPHLLVMFVLPDFLRVFAKDREILAVTAAQQDERKYYHEWQCVFVSQLFFFLMQQKA